MYFIPQKNKWYSTVVHMSPLYRYGATCLMIVLLLFGWRYGLYAWLDSSIGCERMQIAQLQQQLMQLTQAERANAELNNIVPVLKKQLHAYHQADPEQWQQQQFTYVMNESQKAGLQVTSYTDEKEKKKPWGLYRSVQVGLRGSFERINTFLNALKQSPYMIQCNQIQGTKADGDQFAVSCGLKLMTAHV